MPEVRPEWHENERFPIEVANAIEALSTPDARLLLAEMWDCGECHHDELAERLGWSDERLNETSKQLRRGALATQKCAGDITDRTDVTYGVSAYGERFVTKLFESMGDVSTFDSKGGPDG